MDDLLGLRGHDHAHEVARLAVASSALDFDGLHILVEHVPQGAFDQVFFFVDQRRRDRLQRLVADVLPQTQQVFVVALDFGLGARGAGGADDQAHAVRHVERGGGGLQALAVCGVGDFAADAAAPRRVRHQDAVPARQRKIGGEGRALVAALFLDDLHQHDLAALDHLLDLVATHQAAAAALHLRVHVVVFVPRRLVRLVLVVVLRSLAHQRFAVGDRDLIVVGVDFVEGQEAVPVAAVLDEGGLQAGFDPGYLGEVDVAPKLALRSDLEIKLLDPGAIHHHDAGFFRVGGVDQHSFGH